MAKKDNTLFWISGIIILLVFVLPNIQKQNEFATINVHYYKNGVEVQPQRQFFSVVTPPGGSYDSIAFSVTAQNTGAAPINSVSITSFTGGTTSFLSSFTSTSFGNLAVGQSITLTSNPISTLQFETLTQPVQFIIQVGGTNTYNNQPLNQQGSVSLTIQHSSTPGSLCYQESANVSIGCGGLNTGYYSLSPYYFYATYSKPTGVLSTSTWQVKFGGRVAENITIPISCWNYNSSAIKFRFFSNGYDQYGRSWGQCYDGTTVEQLIVGWKTITAVAGGDGSRGSPCNLNNKLIYDGNWNTGAYSYYGNQLFYATGPEATYPCNVVTNNNDAAIYEEAMNWRF